VHTRRILLPGWPGRSFPLQPNLSAVTAAVMSVKLLELFQLHSSKVPKLSYLENECKTLDGVGGGASRGLFQDSVAEAPERERSAAAGSARGRPSVSGTVDIQVRRCRLNR